MIRRPPRSTLDRSSAASDVYKRQLTTIHPLNQPTIIHPFHMTKPSQHTFIYSLIYPFLLTTILSNKFIPHFINSSHTLHTPKIVHLNTLNFRSILLIPDHSLTTIQ